MVFCDTYRSGPTVIMTFVLGSSRTAQTASASSLLALGEGPVSDNHKRGLSGEFINPSTLLSFADPMPLEQRKFGSSHIHSSCPLPGGFPALFGFLRPLVVFQLGISAVTDRVSSPNTRHGVSYGNQGCPLLFSRLFPPVDPSKSFFPLSFRLRSGGRYPLFLLRL